MRSSWLTSATNRRCTRDSSSSWRICRCRLVAIWLNDDAEARDVVLAADVHPLLEPTGGEPLGDPAGEPHRA